MNTKTKAQRINKRQDAIWDKAKALATANAQDERILNASAKAIGPCHLPSKREMADKSVHTPGPWAYAYGAVYGTNSEGEWLGARLLLADRNDPSTAPTERDANCRLAAAAPDLLAALKALADASATVGNLDHAGVTVPADAWAEMYAANNAARAAIAKAEAQ